LGHALRKVVGVIARQQGRGLPEVAAEAGTPLVAGSSVQAALDLDWDDPSAQLQALTRLLDALQAVEQWLDTAPIEEEAASRGGASLAVAQQVCAQDLTTAPDGTLALRHGVAEDRRMSIEDAERRHERKSRSLLVDGYKRPVRRDLDSRLIVAVGVTPANVPEASVTDAIATDLAAQKSTLHEWHIDRAYLASSWSSNVPLTWPFSVKRGQSGQVHISPRVPSIWIGNGMNCVVLAARRCRLSPVEWASFPRPPVRTVRCGRGVPRARRAAASAFIPMKPCCRSCVSASSPPKGARGCASASLWNTPWPM
jgi:hypothetical protein